MPSDIEWTDETWNPVVGCSVVSPGCTNCYAMRLAGRRLKDTPKYQGLTQPSKAGPVWNGQVRFWEPALTAPLRWRAPRKIFVNSEGDLFHESIPDEWIDRVFAVMALCPQHTFQVLTKRAERMRGYAINPETPARIARAADAIAVAMEIAQMGPEEIRPIDTYPGYFVSDRGRVLSSSGSARCLFCGGSVTGPSNKAYCSKKCRQNACFYRRTGRPIEMERALTEMSPDEGDQGHLRVMLYRDGGQFREGVHRLVLAAFDRSPAEGEQGCHRDGNAKNNALPNLRWGDQSSNWIDRIRHSGDMQWPLPNVWKGTSVERQEEADERIPLLLQTPAAVRFISAEPLLGAIDLTRINRSDATINALIGDACYPGAGSISSKTLRGHRLDWIIVGGESGSGARPMEERWALSLRDQCATANVPFFFKQWGAFAPDETTRKTLHKSMTRVGKKAAGRLLHGREHNEFPNTVAREVAA